ANTLSVSDNGTDQVIVYSVMDAKGCIVGGNITVDKYLPLTGITFSVDKAPVCPTHVADIRVAAVGGYAIAKYEIISPITVDNGNNPLFTDLATNVTYLFKVTDANGCSIEDNYKVEPVVNITVSGELVSDVTCNVTPAVANGAVKFTVGSFATTYSYSVNGGVAVTGQTASTIDLTGLGTGPYVIVVIDEVTGCDATATVTVGQPNPLTLTEVSNINANCNNGAQVTVLAGGGTPAYTYAFVANNVAPVAADYTSSASAVLPFTAPAPNDYDVWVKDSNGCTFKLDIVINEDASPVIVMPAAQCFVGTAFTIDLSVGQTVSKLPATYTINGSGQSASTYSITAPGTYQLSITDGNGCVSNTVSYEVKPQLTLSANMTQDLTCIANASVTLTASGGTSTYVSYEVNDGSGYVASANPFTTGTDGTYKFRVTDSQGCQAESGDVIVTPRTTPTALVAETHVSCFGGSNGTITLTPADGLAPYSYTLTGAGANTSGDVTGTYTGLP
ncbi:hypothetical protein DMB65_21820, partial [Flavobacterium cheongpyeongense]